MEGDDAAAELIPGTEIEAARLDVRRASQGGVEVPLVEQPSPSDSAAGQSPGSGKGLDPLDVEMEVCSRLVGAQESHSDPMIPDRPLYASRWVLTVPEKSPVR